MTSTVSIALVTVVCASACALCGVFLVLRRLAMMADAISHSVLPGLVAGYVLANGPNLWTGFLGATAAGLLTAFLVETLTKSKRVHEDAAIGIVFPALFALGVVIVSKWFSDVHLDTDAVLMGSIEFAPFDTLVVGDRDLGPQALWVLGGLTLVNGVFLAALYKELKLSTFDAGLAAALGFAPVLLHYAMMAIVALTTVGSFSAVGAILSVALIIVPPVTASLLTHRLPTLIALSLLVGIVSGLGGFALASAWGVSISGMIAATLGGVFFVVLLAAPSRGLVAQALRRRTQRAQFTTEMLVVHLATHEGTAEQREESSLIHLERELNWTRDAVGAIVARAKDRGYVTADGVVLNLTQEGRSLAATVAER